MMYIYILYIQSYLGSNIVLYIFILLGVVGLGGGVLWYIKKNSDVDLLKHSDKSKKKPQIKVDSNIIQEKSNLSKDNKLKEQKDYG